MSQLASQFMKHLMTVRAEQPRGRFSFLDGKQRFASPAVLAVVLAFSLLLADQAAAAAWLWAGALMVVGMPHGAYDLAAMRRHSAAGTWRAALRRFVPYTGFFIACSVVFVIAPVASVVAFLVLTMHHFGVSDAVLTRGRVGLSVREHVMGFSHGVVVIATPFVFDAQGAWEPFRRIALLCGEVPAIAAREVVAVAMVVLVGGVVGCGVQVWELVRARRMGAALEEILVLGLAFACGSLVSPLLAIGLYFVVIHAAGHCGRAWVPGRVSEVGWWANVARVHVESLVLLVPSVVMVLGLAWWIGGAWVEAVAIAFLLFCVVATLGHHLFWMRGLRSGTGDESRR